MVSGLGLTSSAETTSSKFGAGAPASFTTNGLGSTPARAVSVPGVAPDGVWGLQPVGLSVVPNEIAPPATPMYVTVVPPFVPPPQPEASTASTPTAPTSPRQPPGRRPRPVTEVGDPG